MKCMTSCVNTSVSVGLSIKMRSWFFSASVGGVIHLAFADKHRTGSTSRYWRRKVDLAAAKSKCGGVTLQNQIANRSIRPAKRVGAPRFLSKLLISRIRISFSRAGIDRDALFNSRNFQLYIYGLCLVVLNVDALAPCVAEAFGGDSQQVRTVR